MKRIRIFISSVQAEFAAERKALYDYLLADALLGRFFEPFLFELLPASDQSTSSVYLHEVENCEIYLGILGQSYGFQDAMGVSPTEHEYNKATLLHRTRLIFLKANTSLEIEPKQQSFIQKVQNDLIRKRFETIDDLKANVYAALVKYLIEKETIRMAPFDANYHQVANLTDLDPEKVKLLIILAKDRRGFPLSENSSISDVLVHLNLSDGIKISNAAILLFGKDPQRFFINSEIRCVHFHGTIVEKPIPSYKVFKGSVFELVDQAVDFVLSKLDYSVGTRTEHTAVSGTYEIPKEIVAEAIVNAVAHRDYTSNASVQVMLFRDRLEILNPGSLPIGWSVEKLKEIHTSVPANPLLANPMFLAGYIERLGTGTADIFRIAKERGLKEPEFIQEETFKAIIYRPTAGEDTGEDDSAKSADSNAVVDKAVIDNNNDSGEDSGEDEPILTNEVKKLLKVLRGEMKRAELQDELQLKHDDYFRTNYIKPALEIGVIEMTLPDSPTSGNQRYRLTSLGEKEKRRLKTKK